MDTTKSVSLRFPPDLKDAIIRVAQQNRRSFNAEIVYRLERSLHEPARPIVHLAPPDEPPEAAA